MSVKTHRVDLYTEVSAKVELIVHTYDRENEAQAYSLDFRLASNEGHTSITTSDLDRDSITAMRDMLNDVLE